MTARGAWRLGLLGHPVGHSLSAILHEAALEALGLAGRYELLDTPPEALAGAVARFRRGAFDGLNVTIPHKEAVAPLCDELSRDAAALGAVNTLSKRGGRVEGHNTDLAGLVAALDTHWPGRPWVGGPVAVLGAGGAARAAVMAAFRTGASEVRLHNRTRPRADALAESLAPHAPGRISATDVASDAVVDAGLVLQATSVGMGTAPDDAPWRRARDVAREILASAPPDAAVYDLVYRPRQTPWVAAAGESGRPARSGLEMLVRQAAAAFSLWTGREAPVDVMRRALG